MTRLTTKAKKILATAACLTPMTLLAANQGSISYHTPFPYNPKSTSIEKLDLSQGNYMNLILPNIVGGVLLGHLIQERYPKINVDNDYIYGSLFGQLLQENISTADYHGDATYINNPTERAQLLAAGQGGPYQLNDYSKRLPSLNTPGSLGLINYTALQASLGYSIQDQDNGNQTQSKGPDSLDTLYFGPIAAAYFHYNDINRLDIINKDSWGPEAKSWPQCLSNLQANKFHHFDMILNAAYNAGTYSDILKTYIDLCAYPDQLGSYTKQISNFNLGDQAYINAFQLPSGYNSLPSWYVNTTFVIYPRQIRFYVDQLDNNNTDLAGSGLSVNNAISFTMAQLENVFEQSMQTLAYVNGNTIYQYINKDQAQAAFTAAMTSNHVNATTVINFNNSPNRHTTYNVINSALSNLENTLHFAFNQTTEDNHTINNQ